MKSLMLSITLASTIVLASGCATVALDKNLVTLDDVYFGAPAAAGLAVAPMTGLSQAYLEINSPNDVSLAAGTPILPSFMRSNPLVVKFVNYSYQSTLNSQHPGIDVTANDISQFSKMASENYGPESLAATDNSKVSKIIEQYLICYYSDTENGFIDREGTVYKRPAIKNTIGNDIITAVVAIVFEGLYDGLLDVPVFTKNGKPVTSGGATPTALKLNHAIATALVDKGAPGIDERELKAMRYLSGMAADHSKTLSGMVLRAFGGLQLEFVFGGYFSIGDNDTLAKTLDTIFEVSSKRLVEATAYNGFLRIPAAAPAGGTVPADTLLSTVDSALP